jgi:hypothetical protein
LKGKDMRSFYMPFIFLIAIVAAALFLGSSDPISVATAHAEASDLLADVPAGAWLADKLLSTLFSIVLSGIVLGIAGLMISQTRQWWRERQYKQRNGKGGPNAHWQQSQPKTPKPISPEKMMQMALLQRLLPPAQSSPTQMPMIVSQPTDDEPDLRF